MVTWQLNWFSHFGRTQSCDQHANTQTDTETTLLSTFQDIYRNSQHLALVAVLAMWANNSASCCWKTT